MRITSSAKRLWRDTRAGNDEERTTVDLYVFVVEGVVE